MLTPEGVWRSCSPARALNDGESRGPERGSLGPLPAGPAVEVYLMGKTPPPCRQRIEAERRR
jgi:hypothetical protein